MRASEVHDWMTELENRIERDTATLEWLKSRWDTEGRFLGL